MDNSSFSDKPLYEEISGLRKRVHELESQLADLRKTKFSPALDGFGQKHNGVKPASWEWNGESEDKLFSLPCISNPGFSDLKASNFDKLFSGSVHNDDLERLTCSWDELVSGKKKTLVEEYRIVATDGSLRWIRTKAHVKRTDSGEPVSINGTNADVTEIKTLEKALEDSEKRYHRLFENAVNGIFRVRLEAGEVVEANARGWEILRVNPAASFGMLSEYLFGADKEAALNELRNNGRIENREVKLLPQKDEAERWISLNASYDADEDLADFTITDITETKNSILELQKINFELDNFVYHSSHDLRSPLKSILGLINILKMEKDQSAQLNCIEMIEGSIIRLDKLVNDLLSLSRNNRINDSFAPINMMIELNNSVTNYYHTAESKNLEIITKVYQPVPFVTDLTRLRIALNNIISNAIKYRSVDKPSSFVKLEARIDSEKARIIIEDNGIGIPQSKLEKVFDMFYRASESSEGSGLGLYIVRNVVEKMNGTVTLRSKEKVGSTFTIEIPNHWNGDEEFVAIL